MTCVVLIYTIARAVTGSVPNWLDLRRAPARQQIAGEVAGDRLPRLAQANVAVDEAVQFDAELSVPEYRSAHVPATVSGRIVADLQLQCQRCLDAMPWRLETEFHWALVAGDDDAEDSDAEPVLLQDDKWMVTDAITDEILLALPSYPRHAEACAVVDGAADTED